MSPAEQDHLLNKIDSNTNSITAVDTRLQIAEKEITGLRTDRHAHGTSLQIHEIQIELLKQTMESNVTRIESLEAVTDKHRTQLFDLKSDVRILMWRVAVITGVASGVVAVIINVAVNHIWK